jgi:hypothetical protein
MPAAYHFFFGFDLGLDALGVGGLLLISVAAFSMRQPASGHVVRHIRRRDWAALPAMVALHSVIDPLKHPATRN